MAPNRYAVLNQNNRAISVRKIRDDLVENWKSNHKKSKMPGEVKNGRDEEIQQQEMVNQEV